MADCRSVNPAVGADARSEPAQPNQKGRDDMKEISTLLINPSRLFREGLKTFLCDSTYPVEAEAGDVAKALEMVRTGLRPMLMILDFSADGPTDLDIIKRIREMVPDVKLVLLGNDVSPEKLRLALDAGFDGCTAKDISPKALVHYLDLVMTGERALPADMITTLAAHNDRGSSSRLDTSRLEGLSAREAEILECLVNGDPNKVIARRLNIAEATVKVHLKAILRKINANNRTQAALWAFQRGIGSSGPFASPAMAMQGSAARMSL